MALGLSILVEAAAKGVASAVLDKAEAMLQRDVKANDSITDPGLLRRIREAVAAKIKPTQK